jgi:hypothetical protein
LDFAHLAPVVSSASREQKAMLWYPVSLSNIPLRPKLTSFNGLGVLSCNGGHSLSHNLGILASLRMANKPLFTGGRYRQDFGPIFNEFQAIFPFRTRNQVLVFHPIKVDAIV